MKQIEITKQQFEELVLACENTSLEISYYFDMKTGDVEVMSDYIEIDEDLSLSIEEALGDRYIRVPGIEASDSYNDMVEYATMIEDKKRRTHIQSSLSGRKGVFRRFKDTLSNYPNLLEQWYIFKEKRNKERIINLFEEEEIKIIIKT